MALNSLSFHDPFGTVETAAATAAPIRGGSIVKPVTNFSRAISDSVSVLLTSIELLYRAYIWRLPASSSSCSAATSASGTLWTRTSINIGLRILQVSAIFWIMTGYASGAGGKLGSLHEQIVIILDIFL